MQFSPRGPASQSPQECAVSPDTPKGAWRSEPCATEAGLPLSDNRQPRRNSHQSPAVAWTVRTALICRHNHHFPKRAGPSPKGAERATVPFFPLRHHTFLDFICPGCSSALRGGRAVWGDLQTPRSLETTWARARRDKQSHRKGEPGTSACSTQYGTCRVTTVSITVIATPTGGSGVGVTLHDRRDGWKSERFGNRPDHRTEAGNPNVLSGFNFVFCFVFSLTLMWLNFCSPGFEVTIKRPLLSCHQLPHLHAGS